MSEFADDGQRPRVLQERKMIEPHLMFAACFILFFCRAVVVRMLPWSDQAFFRHSTKRKSIFGEAKAAASSCVASSFMGI